MAINFQNVSLLDYDQSSRFWGQAFNYQNQKSLSLQGEITELSNQEGVSGILRQIDEFYSGDNDYQDIIINGHNFGNGRITNVNFEQGNDVRVKKYTIGITCYETGNLFNLSGSHYENLNEDLYSPYSLIENLSESVSYNLDGQTIGYSHDVDLKFYSGIAANNPISMAKTLAKKLMEINSPLDFLLSGYNTDIGRRLYKESYDVISNQCSFSETYSRDKNNSGVIYNITNSFSRGEDGNSIVAEAGIIELFSGELKPANFNLLSYEIDELVNDSFSRCNSFFSNYSGENTYELYTGYSSFEKSLNIFSNKGSYSISYTNNPAQLSGFGWSYTHDLSKQGNFYNVTENGNIVGYGTPRYEGNSKAEAGYLKISPSIYSRIYNFYSGELSPGLFGLNRITEQKSSSYSNGTITYQQVFTDNPNFSTSGVNITTEKVTIEDSLPILLTSKYNIFNAKEIVQSSNNSTLGNRSVNLELVGNNNVKLDDFRDYAKIKLNENIPSGIDTFLNSITYEYNPFSKNFSANAAWTFQGDANITI